MAIKFRLTSHSVILTTILLFPTHALAQAAAVPAAPAPSGTATTIATFQTVCHGGGLEDFLQTITTAQGAKYFDVPYQRNYPILIFDVSTPTKPVVYWKPADMGSDQELTTLKQRGFSPPIYTRETALILVCNAKFGDGSSADDKAITVDASSETELHILKSFDADDSACVDRVYLIDSVKDNTLTRINLNVSVATSDQNTAENTQSCSARPPIASPAGTKGPKNHNFDLAKAPREAPTPPKGTHTTDTPPLTPKTDVVAWTLIERHKMIHFSAGAGIVAFHSRPTNYSNVSVPTTVTTAMCTGKLITNTATTANGLPSGSPGYQYDPCSSAIPAITTIGTNITSYESNSSTATASNTVSYLLGVKGQPWQVDALAGMTVYPWGRDTYPIDTGKGFGFPYSVRHPSLSSVGVYLGTSINNFGNFTVGPAYEFFPGVQVVTGLTMWNRTTPQAGIVPCTGYGPSPSYRIAPNSTGDDIVTTYNPATGTTGASITVTETKTSTTTSATSGCTNGDKATFITSGSTPTQTAYVPAFSVGVIFNSNLSKAFSGIFK